VSSITVIPYIYWALAGMVVAYSRLAARTVHEGRVEESQYKLPVRRARQPARGFA